MNHRTDNRSSGARRGARLASLAVLGGLTLGGAALSGASTASADVSPPIPVTQDGIAASKWPTRYQNWSQVPGNRAGVVFRPAGDKFETWDYRDGRRSTVYWNYKGVKDSWKKIRLQDGAH